MAAAARAGCELSAPNWLSGFPPAFSLVALLLLLLVILGPTVLPEQLLVVTGVAWLIASRCLVELWYCERWFATVELAEEFEEADEGILGALARFDGGEIVCRGMRAPADDMS